MGRERLIVLAVALVAVAGAAACSDGDRAEGAAVTVDGVAVDAADIEQELAAIAGNEDFRTSLERSTGVVVRGEQEGSFNSVFVARVVGTNILEVLVDAELTRRRTEVTDEARKRAADLVVAEIGSGDRQLGDRVFAAFPEWYRDRLVHRSSTLLTLQADLAGVPVVLTDQALGDAVAGNPELFERVCSRHVLTASEDDARDVIDRARAGESLADLAREVSLDAGTADDGGDRGCATRDQFAAAGQPAYGSAIFTGSVGLVPEPVQTVLGWHAVEIYDRRLPAADELADGGRDLLAGLVSETFDRWFETALVDAEITVDPRFGSWDPDRLIVVPVGIDAGVPFADPPPLVEEEP